MRLATPLCVPSGEDPGRGGKRIWLDSGTTNGINLEDRSQKFSGLDTLSAASTDTIQRMPAKKPYCASEVERVHEALEARFKQELGSVSRVERALGVSRDYFSYHRKTKRIDHGALLATLRELDIDPAVFFAGLYGSPVADAARAGGPADKSSPVAGIELPADLDGMTFGPADAELADALEPWLVEMDELRYDDCEAALAELRARADEIPVDAGARWLSVTASCLRMAGDFDDALSCLDAALVIAPDQRVVANVLQRKSYVVRDLGDFKEALHLSEWAAGIFGRIGDQESVGKTYVDQGGFFYLLGELPAAIGSIRKAMKLIPTKARRNWQSIHQYLALCLQKVGSLTESHGHALQAEALANDSHQRANVLWLQAEILQRMGRTQEAGDAYESSLELIPDQPFERLLATAHLVKTRALDGDPDRAAQAARSVTDLIGTFGRNRTADALILEMYRLTARDCAQRRKLDKILHAAERLRPSAKDGTLGGRLRRARRRQGISRRELAAILEMAEKSLLNIERGRMPGICYAGRIVDWLHAVSPESQLAGGVLRRK